MLQIYDLSGNKIHSIHSDKSIFLSKKSNTGSGKPKGTNTPKKKKDGSVASTVNSSNSSNGSGTSTDSSSTSLSTSPSTSLSSSAIHLTSGSQHSEPLEPNKKILHAVWHPKEDTMAIAATNNLFIFSGIS